ncbi:signal peptide peptidase-like 2B [Rhipicephalus microplus]|uniref:signal peptide peptidase-like 2B n=1 Tax=Rhipicephalus microplus TaxID=6941 RepID=UPI003F6AF2CF
MAAQDSCLPLHGINLTGAVVLINDTSRCPLETAARNYGNTSAYALVVGLSDNRLDDSVYERTSSEQLNISVGFINRRSFVILLKMMTANEQLMGFMFAKEYGMDVSLILVWFIATFSVAAGAFWAGTVSYHIYRYHAHTTRKLAGMPSRRAVGEMQKPGQPSAEAGAVGAGASGAAGGAAGGAVVGGAAGAGAGGAAHAGVGGAAGAGAAAGAVAGAGAAAASGDVSKRDIVGTKRMTESSVGDIDAELTPVGILVFVVFMSSSLVIIYLLIQYLVYVIIGMFVLASSVALIGVLDPLVHRLPVGTMKIPMIPCFYIQLEVRQVCVIVLSILVSFSFVVVRHHPLSWLMQDALGITFCIYMIRTLRMPNLQIIAILLVLLFFYDIFFVFVTPLFLPKSSPHNATNSFAKSSGKGDSIMVEVARGGGTDELIPMVFRVPRLGDHDLAACFGEWTLLGLGDILIPGFLVAYVHGFDLIASQRRFYYTVTVIGYGVGLVVTFLALFLMKTAQPALLYLVPATLIPVVAIARCRGELNDIWYGFKPVTPPPSEEAEPPAVVQGKEPRTDSRRKSLDKSEETTSTAQSGSAVGDSPATRSPAQPQRVVRPTIASPAGAASSVQPPALLSTMFTLGMR